MGKLNQKESMANAAVYRRIYDELPDEERELFDRMVDRAELRMKGRQSFGRVSAFEFVAAALTSWEVNRK